MRLYPECERKLPFSVVGPLFWEIVEKRSITLLSQEMSSEDAQDEEEEDGRAEKSDPLLSGYHHYRKIDLRFAAMLQSLVLLFPSTISFRSSWISSSMTLPLFRSYLNFYQPSSVHHSFSSLGTRNDWDHDKMGTARFYAALSNSAVVFLLLNCYENFGELRCLKLSMLCKN